MAWYEDPPNIDIRSLRSVYHLPNHFRMDEKGIKDKVALMTGDGKGIGKAIAQRFIDTGAWRMNK